MGKYEFVGPVFEKTTEEERALKRCDELFEEFMAETERLYKKKLERVKWLKESSVDMLKRHDPNGLIILTASYLFGLDRGLELKKEFNS